MMDQDERLRRALAAFGGGSDVWELVDAALASAAAEDLRVRRDGIVERLYCGGGSRCDAPSPPPAPCGEEEEKAAASPEAESDAEELGGTVSKILAIRDFLEDPDQTQDDMVSLLQNLADMDITYKTLQETDIGRHVNSLRKHPSGEVRLLAKQLIRKWKEIVDDWMRLHNSSGDGGSSIITDGDSPAKIQSRTHQSAQVSDFKYSPSPQNFSSSERANNGAELKIEAKRRTSPAPTYHNARQINNNHSTIPSSAPAKIMRGQKDGLVDLDRLDSARKRLQENYQEAQNAKKQRTTQVMDISDIPKPKNSRKSGGGGLPARHR